MKKIILLLLLFPLALHSQVAPERHNTSWIDMWISCNTSPNPINDYGDSHWFMIDLGHNYSLGELKLWNYNDPQYLNRGIQDYAIDISLNGITWLHVGDYSLPMSNSSSFYDGFVGPDLAQPNAKFVLITAKSNYGGDCFGLSELKINVDQPIVSSNEDLVQIEENKYKISPNPFENSFLIENFSQNSFPDRYQILTTDGKLIKESFLNKSNIQAFNIVAPEIPSGNYNLLIIEKNNVHSLKLVKK
jgi:hypothetical protein